MKRTCQRDGCGKEFEAKRSTAKWCSKSCNVRASQTRGKVLTLVPGPPPPAGAEQNAGAAGAAGAAPPTNGVLAATTAELEKIGATNTPMGQLALQHAARLQYVADTASGIAALSRELRQVLDAARASASGGGGDRLDEINRRRTAKHKAAGS